MSMRSGPATGMLILLVLSSNSLSTDAPAAAAPNPLANPSANPAGWQVVAPSSISFVAVQAGAPFAGEFERFDAQIHFSPEALEDSSFTVSIDLASVATGYGERDEILRGPEFFDIEAQPQAVYQANRFTRLGNGRFRADGTLLIRGIEVPTSVTFEFTPAPGAGALRMLVGETAVNRLDFDIGLGDWRDDKWIGHIVKIQFSLSIAVFPD